MAKNSPYADWYAGHTRTDHGGHDLPKAAIFDLDGTLLDSVDLHAIAPMVKCGHDVSFEQA
jgi:hypothetical protein